MLCVTTNSIDGKVVLSYCGVVAAEVVFGVDFIRDFVASISDVVGGRSTGYEKEFEAARQTALEAIVKKAEGLRANAILAIHFDYQVLGEKNGMMMVAASGTAVQLAKSDSERAKDEERALEDKPQYFITLNGTEKGPFSITQLRELVVAGRIDEFAEVRVDGRSGTRALADLFRKN